MYKFLNRKHVVIAISLMFSLLFCNALAEQPAFSISFSKESYSVGEPVTAYYDISFDGEYSEISCSWGIVTDWDEQSSQWSSENNQNLLSLNGSVSFSPLYGEGVILEMSLREPTGEWHNFWSEPVPVIMLTTMILPNSLTTIASEVFMNTNFAHIICPETVVSIEARAFANCANLRTITIPASVTSIAEDAFTDCPFLTTIIAPENSTAAEFARQHGYTLCLP